MTHDVVRVTFSWRAGQPRWWYVVTACGKSMTHVRLTFDGPADCRHCTLRNVAADATVCS